MARTNGKTETDPVELDLSHELPAAEQENEPATTADPPGSAAAAEDTASLRDQVRRLQAERDLLFNQLARAQAEFENARKRARREQTEQREYALAEALRTMLPFMDSLDHALESGAGGELRTGLQLIQRQLHDALNKLGVRVIQAKGKPFDPNYHQAVEMVETSDAPDHQVIDELQRGYMLKDRLLRPAMVRVAKKK